VKNLLLKIAIEKTKNPPLFVTAGFTLNYILSTHVILLKAIKKAVHFVSLHFSVWKKDSSRAKWEKKINVPPEL